MNLEQFESTSEPVETPKEPALGAFLNPVYAEEKELGPKIRFTTDKAEADAAAEAAQAERSGPLDFHDRVIYVGPKEGDGEKSGDSVKPVDSAYHFMNETYDVDVSTFTHDADGEPGGESIYSPAELESKIASDAEHLAFAEEQLSLAIERGTGVIAAMRNVDSAKSLLETHQKMYNDAVSAEEAAPLGSREDGEDRVKLGSVQSATRELERAYESGSKSAIDRAKRHLAQEKAKEDLKKMK